MKLQSRVRKLKDDICSVKVQLEDMMLKGRGSAELVQQLDEKRYQLETWISSCREVFGEFAKGITKSQMNAFLNRFKVSVAIFSVFNKKSKPSISCW